MATDLNLVRHALSVARNAEFASVAIEAPNLNFSAELGRASAPAPYPTDATAGGMPPIASTVVKCPLVGYFGVAPKPVGVGDRVTVGDVIGIVAALGIPNEVLSDLGGVVEQLLVADGDPVEFGQPLIRVKAE